MLVKKAVRLKFPDELYKKFKDKHAAEGFTFTDMVEMQIKIRGL